MPSVSCFMAATIQPWPAIAVSSSNFPGVSQLWAELGLAAAGNLNFTLAHQASQRAAELAAKDSSLLVSLGQQYHRLRCLEQASACFEGAVAADPSSVHARLSLAAWLERNRRIDEAWDCVETCLDKNPRDGRVLYYRAFLLHRKGPDADAEIALRRGKTARQAGNI
jgi:Tfp pilus assembly protein PilF